MRTPTTGAQRHLQVGARDRASQFLTGLTPQQADTVLAAATKRSYLANSVILNQGQSADYLFLLRTGCARHFHISEHGRKVILLWVQPGEILGAAALLPTPSTYIVSTEMVKDSSVFVWDRETVRELTRQYPSLLDNALSYAFDYLTWFLAAHLALSSATASERLANVVQSLAQGIGHKVPGGVQLDVTNEQLANAANISVFTTSRLMSEWCRNGIMKKERGKLILHSPHRLFLVSDPSKSDSLP
jgi:CRP-like cAMP-binding protein